MRDIVPKPNPVPEVQKSPTSNFANKNIQSSSAKCGDSVLAAKMLSNPDACTITRIATSDPEVPINRNDPKVKRMVYSTLRNYLGAYNNQANQLASKHGNVIKDKGVQDQIDKINATGNLPNLNGRIKESED